MALANPCPESPMPWRERRGGKKRGREIEREERGRGRERKYEDYQFIIFVLNNRIEGSPLYEQRIIESYNQDAF